MELIISDADIGSGGNLTCYKETGQHEGALFNLKDHHSDERGNQITTSLPSSDTERHNKSVTGQSIILASTS